MEDLIKALQIFLKYDNPKWPTQCDYDILMISPDIDPSKVSEEDKNELEKLGFLIRKEGGQEVFVSHRFGSC